MSFDDPTVVNLDLDGALDALVVTETRERGDDGPLRWVSEVEELLELSPDEFIEAPLADDLVAPLALPPEPKPRGRVELVRREAPVRIVLGAPVAPPAPRRRGRTSALVLFAVTIVAAWAALEMSPALLSLDVGAIVGF